MSTMQWDLVHEQTREAERRLALLQPILEQSSKKGVMTTYARQIGISVEILHGWLQAFQSGGKEALKPQEWGTVSAEIVQLINERFEQLQPQFSPHGPRGL